MFKNFFSYKANISKMYIISWLQMALFVVPIIVLYFQQNGLTMQQIMILQAIFSIAIVVLEIPSWYVADVLGRKQAIIIWCIFSFVGALFYIFMHSFWWFVIVEIAWGIGTSFISWADSALTYDTLLHLKKEDQYKKTQGRMSSIGSFSESIASFSPDFYLW